MCVCVFACCLGQLKLPVDVLHMAIKGCACGQKWSTAWTVNVGVQCVLRPPPPPPTLLVPLCGVCIYLLVNKTAVYIHSTAQRSPKLKLSRNEAEKEEERGGKGSLASVVFTSGFFSAALSIDRRHVKCDTGTQAYTDAAYVQHDV